ncbi:MAG: gephyrin-like molybdotransferase Glp [Alphaproteobacteria bacterium]
MAQLSDDCFAHGAPLMRAEEALGLLDRRLVALTETEAVSLAEATGRILAAPVVSDRDVPPHDNSAVDGYAVYHDDLDADVETRLPVTGRAAAGHPLERPAERGEAIRIFTGAPMPRGHHGDPDTVMMQEDCRLDGASVILAPGIERGANRRRRGEDVRAGSLILDRGRRLRAHDVGLVASIGRTELPVYRRLGVAVLSTGDEVREPGTSLEPGAVYDANRYCLMGLLSGLGCEVDDLGILPDSDMEIRERLLRSGESHDLIIASGGVSAGEEDHVRSAVESLGRIHFWKLAIKPGRPVAMGQIGATPFIGLPGNPAAMVVTFMWLARPAVLRLSGAVALKPNVFKVRASFDHTKKRNRREYLRARLRRGPDGALEATKFPRHGAGILTSLVESDGLVELGEDLTRLSAGTMVDFMPFSELS